MNTLSRTIISLSLMLTIAASTLPADAATYDSIATQLQSLSASVSELQQRMTGQVLGAQTDSVSGLVARYDLDSLPSGTTIGDPTVVSGNEGSGAVAFDGDDGINLGQPSALNITDTITFSAWVKSTATQLSGWGRVISRTNGATSEDWGMVISTTNEVDCRVNGSNRSGHTLTEGVWHHVACTYDGSTVRTYVDGAQVDSYNHSNALATDQPVSIGYNVTGGATRHFIGELDDVRVYNRALSAEEVNAVRTGGETTEADADNDGVTDSADNCPNTANADQADADNDGTGDVCDSTPDGETTPEPDPIPLPTTGDYPRSADEVGITSSACPNFPQETTGSLTIKNDGSVLENVQVNGRINIEASDVTINCVKASGGLYTLKCDARDGCTNLRVTNSEFFGANSAAIYLVTGETNAYIKDSFFGGAPDGIKMNSTGNTFEGNYMGCFQAGSADAHMDGMQARAGSDNAFINNTMIGQACAGSANQSTGSGIIFFEEGVHTRTLLTGNYFSGAGYTIRLGGSTHNDITFTNNVVERGSYSFGPLRLNFNSNNCLHWEGNSYDDGSAWTHSSADTSCALPTQFSSGIPTPDPEPDPTPNPDPTPQDTDNDGVADTADNCPTVANAAQTDTDNDGTGDACDATPNGDTSTDNPFAAGTRVQTTDTVNVRDPYGLSGAVLGTQSTGAQGTVLDIDAQTVDGYTWIAVDFDTAPDGWVASDFITTFTTPEPEPTPSTNHPKLLLNQSEINAIKAKVSSNQEPWRSAYSDLLNDADRAIDRGFSLITASNRTIPRNGYSGPDYSNFNQARKDLVTVALAWKFSGQTKYRDHARVYIDAFFLDSSTGAQPVYNDGVYGTWLMSGMFYGLDLMWDDLNSGTRAALSDWIDEYHQELLTSSESYNFGLDDQHNRSDWFAATLAMTAVMTGDQSALEDTIDYFKGREVDSNGKFLRVGGSSSVSNEDKCLSSGSCLGYRDISYGHYALSALTQLLEVVRHNSVNLYTYDTDSNGDSKIKRMYDYYQQWSQFIGENEKELYEIAYALSPENSYLDVITDQIGRPINNDNYPWINTRAITLTHARGAYPLTDSQTPDPDPDPDPEPTPDPVPDDVETSTSVTRNSGGTDFTWEFNCGGQACQYGTFVNGEYWVIPVDDQGNRVSAVTITAISPDGTEHGAEVNPQSQNAQGIVQGYGHYEANLNIMTQLPYQAEPGDSIYKAETMTSGCGTRQIERGCVHTDDVLTVLENVPPNNGATVFRPPFHGDDKPLYTTDKVMLERLSSLPNMPELDVSSIVNRWNVPIHNTAHNSDGFSGEFHRAMRPHAVIDDYAAGTSRIYIDNIFALLGTDSIEEKRPAAYAMMQAGIDVYGTFKLGIPFESGAGQHLGKKPALSFFAALYDNSSILNEVRGIASSQYYQDNNFFQEDSQVRSTDGRMPVWGTVSNTDRYWQRLYPSIDGNGASGDPYGYIDGPAGGPDSSRDSSARSYIHVSSGNLASFAFAQHLFPWMRYANNDWEILTYADRAYDGYGIEDFDGGFWSQPDMCAPRDPRENDECRADRLFRTGSPWNESVSQATGCGYYTITWGPDLDNPGQCIMHDGDPATDGRMPNYHGSGIGFVSYTSGTLTEERNMFRACADPSSSSYRTGACTGLGPDPDPTSPTLPDFSSSAPIDTDNDTIPNTSDNCPSVANINQTDTDNDGTGDACDATPNGDTTPPSGDAVYELSSRTFNGTTGDVINLPHSSDFALTEGTVAFTFNANSVASQQGLVVKDSTGYGAGGHFATYLRNGEFFIRMQNGSTEAYTSAPVAAGVNNVVVATFSPTEVTASLNGATILNQSFNASWSNNTEYLQIGGLGWGSAAGASAFADPFSGTISNLTITGTVDTTPDTSTDNPFSANSRVQTTDTVNVRDPFGLSGTLLGTQDSGAQGTVLDLPAQTADGYTWIAVDFDTAPDGWVVTDFVSAISTPDPEPDPDPTPGGDVTVSNASELEDAIDNAGSGDVIELATGNYGDLIISRDLSGSATIRAAEDAAPTFNTLILDGNHWVIDGVEVRPSSRVSQAVDINGNSITFQNSTVSFADDASGWSANDWINNTGHGITVGGQENNIINNTIRVVDMGIMGRTSGTRIAENLIDGFRGDGMQFNGNDSERNTSNMVIENNTIRNNYRVDGNHDDGIQFYTRGSDNSVGNGVIKDIVIRGNTVIQTTDQNRNLNGPLQGLGNFDGMFEDWLLEDNVIAVDQWHGISMYGSDNVTIRNNTVVEQVSGGNTAWIGIFDHKNGTAPTNSLIENNIATRYSGASTGVTSQNNVTISVSDYDDYFVDWQNFDFTLRDDAPVSGVGANANGPVDAPSDPTPTGDFTIGDQITVTADTVNIRSTASRPADNNNLLGRQNTGAVGTVLAGPTTNNNGIYGTITWYQVDFTTGTDGWVGDDNLSAYTASDNATDNPFSANSRVQTTDTVNVRDPFGLSGTLLGTQDSGAQGTVLDLPAQTADGYTWIAVDFDTAPDGWVVTDFVSAISTPDPEPDPDPTPGGDVTVSNASELQTALNNATGGETILLESGNYGGLVLNGEVFSDYVTIRSAAGQGAQFDGIRIENSSYIGFDSISVDGSISGNGGAGVRIEGGNYVNILNSDIGGGNKYDRNNPSYTQVSQLYGVWVGEDSNNITVENNYVHDIQSSGFAFFGVDGLVLRGNNADWVAADGYKFGGVNDALVENNTGMQQVHASPDAHKDFMQIQAAVTNSTFRGNWALMNTTHYQGIFSSSEGNEDILIENNIIYSGNARGISVGGDNITARYNTVLAAEQNGDYLVSKAVYVTEADVSEYNISAYYKAASGVSGTNHKLQYEDPNADYYYDDYYVNASAGPGLTIEDFRPVAGSPAEDEVGAFARIFELLGETTPDPEPDPDPTPQDTDNDGIADTADNCPSVANAAQTDTDNDGTGDACDTTPNGDVTAPSISAVTVDDIGQTEVVITWNTNELATSEVRYGTDSDYSNSTNETNTVATAHSVIVSGLSADTTYHFQVVSRDAAGNTAASGDRTFTTLTTPDTTDPTVSITTPSNGATVSGVITIAAAASDPTVTGEETSGVASVSFRVDSSLIATDTAAPYDTGLDTNTLSDGTHTLTVTAVDGAGNSSTDTVSITTDNVVEPPADTTDPTITFVEENSTNNDPITHVITFETNEPATSVLMFGTNRNNLNNDALNTTLSTTHTFTLEGLSNKENYYYALVATDTAGNNATSDTESFRTIGKPQKVNNLTARSGSIILEWELPEDENIDEIVVIRRTGGATGKTTDDPIATLDEDETTYTDEEALTDRRYTYTVYTISDGDYSDPISVTFKKEKTKPDLTDEAEEEVKEEERRRSGGGGGSSRSLSGDNANDSAGGENRATAASDRITTTDNLKVRATANGAQLAIQPAGAAGTRDTTRAPLTLGGYTWVYVDFDTGFDGWVAQSFTQPETTTDARINRLLELISLLRQILALQLQLGSIR